MADSHALLSDQWHLVEGLRAVLRPDCPARRQSFRGRLWYVISDPFANRHFRLRPEAWRFLARLDRRRTIEEIWREMIEEAPDEAPGQREVIDLMTQLHGANLLLVDSPPETWSMVSRRKKEKQKATRQQWMNFLFLRIPLFDPNALLERLNGIGRLLIGPFGLLLWLGLAFMGAKAVIDDWGQFREQTQGVLSQSNLVWLYLTWAVVKVFHELGHGMVAKRFGGEVRSCGVMLLVFTPVPFVDVSASWAFRERWQRLLVGGAGMIFELGLAAVAALVWARTGGEGTMGQVAYNIVFLASVSTIMFNLNPLLRFDGYYILADWVGVPNLHQQAARQWRRWFEIKGLGLDGPAPVARSRRGALGLGLFGAGAAVYRVFVLLVIVAFIAGQLFEVGFLLAIVGMLVWLGGPLWKFYRYLVSDARVREAKTRVWLWGLGAPLLIALILFAVPMPHAVRAPGIVDGGWVSEAYAGADGRLAALPVPSGSRVKAGQVLVRLESPDLIDQERELRAVRREISVRRSQAWSRLPAVVQPLDARLKSIDAQLLENTARQNALIITAERDGVWSSPALEWRIGAPVRRGTLLGKLRAEDKFIFKSVVRARDVDRLTRSATRSGELRLRGNIDESIPVTLRELRPAESKRLPSVSLGWRGGGDVPTDPTDAEGVLAKDPFFVLPARLPEGAAPSLYLRTGVLRVKLDSQPWGIQWLRRVRQFIQERYGR